MSQVPSAQASASQGEPLTGDAQQASRVAQARAQLLQFADRFGALAARMRRRTRPSLLLALLNALAFGWLLWVAWDGSLWLSIPLFIVVTLPSVLVVMVYMAFDSAAELPQTMRELGDTLNDIAARMVRDRATETLDLPEQTGVMGRLRRGLGALRYLASLGGQVWGVSDLVSGLLFIVNPLFPVLMLVGVIGVWSLAPLALILVSLQ